jgi:hypothetical protein
MDKIRDFLERYRLNQEWAIADLYDWYNTEYPGLSCRKFTRLIAAISGCKLRYPRINGRQMAHIYLGDTIDDPAPVPTAPPDTRYCPRCRTVKPLAEFFARPGYCKPCNAQYRRSYYRAYISPRRKK